LSSCVEAIIAAQIGDMEKAIRYGMAALLMDLADVGGNVRDGCHIASMGGTWMTLAYGFGGMRDNDGTLSFWPRRAPQDNAILRFPLTYRGQMLEIEIGLEKVEYALREGEYLVIHPHHRRDVQPARQGIVPPAAARLLMYSFNFASCTHSILPRAMAVALDSMRKFRRRLQTLLSPAERGARAVALREAIQWPRQALVSASYRGPE
jgi:hypothetical protein